MCGSMKWGIGFWSHSCLVIINLSEASPQPILSHSGNSPSLFTMGKFMMRSLFARNLNQLVFIVGTFPDTEVLLAACELWDVKLLFSSESFRD